MALNSTIQRPPVAAHHAGVAAERPGAVLAQRVLQLLAGTLRDQRPLKPEHDERHDPDHDPARAPTTRRRSSCTRPSRRGRGSRSGTGAQSSRRPCPTGSRRSARGRREAGRDRRRARKPRRSQRIPRASGCRERRGRCPRQAPLQRSTVDRARVRQRPGRSRAAVSIGAVSDDGVVDITILGAGPAGLAAAYYAGHRDASVRIIESLEQLGGQVAAVYPEKHVYDVAGHPKIHGHEARRALRRAGPAVRARRSTSARRCRRSSASAQNGEELLAIGTDKGGPYLTRALIITAGHGAFEPRKLGIEGIDDWEGKGVHYFVREKDVFRDRTCVIVGGGDSALDWTLGLQDTAKAADRARPPARQLPRARVVGQRGARARGRGPRPDLDALRGARAPRRRHASRRSRSRTRRPARSSRSTARR